jgi:hypothetical protein
VDQRSEIKSGLNALRICDDGGLDRFVLRPVSLQVAEFPSDATCKTLSSRRMQASS